MLVSKNDAEVGVVVGRFHVDDLHKGHIELIDSVNKSHDRMILVLGLSPCKCTMENPLDFESRRTMLQGHYPEATVVYIKDVKDDSDWSDNLDEQVENMIGPEQSVQMYGSRDSFIPYYNGRYPVNELTQESYVSGTEIRRKLAIKSKNTKDFRAGVIWGLSNRYAGPMMTIDIAIFTDDMTRILLGRKKEEKEFRVIGGFVASGEILEATAIREAKEETHLDVCDLQYSGSFVIDDWRYIGEREKITTALFSAKIKGGKPDPDDDIFELKWFKFNNKLPGKVVDNHVILIQALLKQHKVG